MKLREKKENLGVEVGKLPSRFRALKGTFTKVQSQTAFQALRSCLQGLEPSASKVGSKVPSTVPGSADLAFLCFVCFNQKTTTACRVTFEK